MLRCKVLRCVFPMKDRMCLCGDNMNIKMSTEVLSCMRNEEFRRHAESMLRLKDCDGYKLYTDSKLITYKNDAGQKKAFCLVATFNRFRENGERHGITLI